MSNRELSRIQRVSVAMVCLAFLLATVVLAAVSSPIRADECYFYQNYECRYDSSCPDQYISMWVQHCGTCASPPCGPWMRMGCNCFY